MVAGWGMDDFQVVLFAICLAFFTGWVSLLSQRIARVVEGLDDGRHEHAERVLEIRDAVKVVGELMEHLPTILREQNPQFHMNSSPFAPIVEAIMANMTGNRGLSTLAVPRGPDGQFNATSEEEENV